MSSNPSPDYEITDYNYIGSAIGNAYFSNVPFCILWECVRDNTTREGLDDSVSAAAAGQELLDKAVKKFYGRA